MGQPSLEVVGGGGGGDPDDDHASRLGREEDERDEVGSLGDEEGPYREREDGRGKQREANSGHAPRHARLQQDPPQLGVARGLGVLHVRGRLDRLAEGLNDDVQRVPHHKRPKHHKHCANRPALNPDEDEYRLGMITCHDGKRAYHQSTKPYDPN